MSKISWEPISSDFDKVLKKTKYKKKIKKIKKRSIVVAVFIVFLLLLQMLDEFILSDAKIDIFRNGIDGN